VPAAVAAAATAAKPGAAAAKFSFFKNEATAPRFTNYLCRRKKKVTAAELPGFTSRKSSHP
jgi:hypothetical protein